MNQLFKEIIGQDRKKKRKTYLVTFEYCEATDHRSCGRFVCFYRRKKTLNADAPKRSDAAEC